jgi:hypothetical protein
MRQLLYGDHDEPYGDVDDPILACMSLVTSMIECIMRVVCLILAFAMLFFAYCFCPWRCCFFKTILAKAQQENGAPTMAATAFFSLLTVIPDLIGVLCGAVSLLHLPRLCWYCNEAERRLKISDEEEEVDWALRGFFVCNAAVLTLDILLAPLYLALTVSWRSYLMLYVYPSRISSWQIWDDAETGSQSVFPVG